MMEIIFNYIGLIVIGIFIGFLVFKIINRSSYKAQVRKEFLNGCRYAEIERKCRFYENQAKELEEDFNILSKENTGLEQRISKLKTENKALFDKAIISEAKIFGDEEYILYLESLLDKSNITYIDRQSNERLLGDESNE